jgi:hypothetical protein
MDGVMDVVTDADIVFVNEGVMVRLADAVHVADMEGVADHVEDIDIDPLFDMEGDFDIVGVTEAYMLLDVLGDTVGEIYGKGISAATYCVPALGFPGTGNESTNSQLGVVSIGAANGKVQFICASI